MSDKDTLNLNGIFRFDAISGPIAGTKAQIMNDLITMSKVSFGSEFVIEQGTEWYSFLDVLAHSLADAAGSTLQLYNSLNVNNATGATLDALCALIGITRKGATDASVVIKCTPKPSATAQLYVPAGTILQDSNGNLWRNKDASAQVTGQNSVDVIFYSDMDDSVHTLVEANSTWHVMSTSEMSTQFTYTNENASTDGEDVESDGQLRYRYTKSQHKQSIGTMDALRAKLLEIPEVSYARIYENTTNQNLDSQGIPHHGIWVVVDTSSHIPSTWNDTASYEGSKDVLDIKIAQTILLNKSLGCAIGTGPTAAGYEDGYGTIECNLLANDYGYGNSGTYTIYFTRAKALNIFVYYNLIRSDQTTYTPNAIVIANIESAIKEYINSLDPNTPVSKYQVSLAINKVLSTLPDLVDVNNLYFKLDASSSDQYDRILVDPYQYPNCSSVTYLS